MGMEVKERKVKESKGQTKLEEERKRYFERNGYGSRKIKRRQEEGEA